MESMFKVGTKVVWSDKYVDGKYHYGEVEKVYKNGRFILVGGDKQQFAPSYDGKSAHETGDGYYRRWVQALTPEIEQQIAEDAARRSLSKRAESAQRTIVALRPSAFNEEQVKAMEDLIASFKKD